MDSGNKASTQRVRGLRDILLTRSFSDRTPEWFRHYMFEPVGREELTLIERRAYGIKSMLRAMTNPENSKLTRSYEIKPGELLVGNIAMGSVGLGKVFPNYLTDDEKRLLTVTSRDMQSSFGHNIPDHEKVLTEGLCSIAEYCAGKISELSNQGGFDNESKLSFYQSVVISLEAVRDYANDFADLAETMAEQEADAERKDELIEIARICKNVPWNPAKTFYEAIQSVYFMHLVLHSTLDYVSLGRLDMLLYPFLQRDLESGVITEEKALELFECLLIKCAERLNYNPEHLVKQDHTSFGGVFGVNPVFIDQIASANNFLQNITLGGVTRDGKSASNLCTKLVMRACANLGLATPIVNFRFNSVTPREYVSEAIQSLRKGTNAMPVIFNDDIIIEALRKDGLPLEEARDYGIDGCWEPIMNAKGDWVFGMVNLLTALELSLNSGCTFSADPSLLRGAKISYNTHSADRIQSYDELIDILKVHIQYYMDKTVLTAYTYYNVEGSVAPSPLFSSVLHGCLESGKDKTWGGAEYHLIGALAVGLPNCANALANIRKYVFDEKRYSLEEVVKALKSNYDGYKEMQQVFLRDENKFGNDSGDVDGIMRQLLDYFYECGQKAKQLADKTFLFRPESNEDRIVQNRMICGYEGKSMQEKYGDRFNTNFTLGCGTFGQYTLMGKSVGASADGRSRGDALAPNLSPTTGTMKNGFAKAVASFEKLGMDRFAAGAIMDLCIDSSAESRDDVYFNNLIDQFIDKNGSIMSISCVNASEIEDAFDICEEVRKGARKSEELRKYAHISVRVGGFNSTFVMLPREQQMNYLTRVLK